MSDRIDELMRKSLREVALLAHPQKGDPSPKMLERECVRLITEIATIAREAEARAAEWIDRCYQSDERADKAEAMCEWLAEALADNGWCRQDPEGPCRDDGEDCPKYALAAAREAVTNER